MAPLKVIGAGCGRTGTTSLRIALNKLGYRCHHMIEMMVSGRHPLEFREAYLHPERDTDWDMLYEGFDAGVDWPTASFVKPLMEKYPDAKVILTERDPDAWLKSVRNTIGKMVEKQISADTDGTPMSDNQKMVATIVFDGAFGDREGVYQDDEKMKQLYVEHNAWVKENVPAERLLILQTNELNWEALCTFLGKDVPDEPFPRANTTEDMQAMHAMMKEKGFKSEEMQRHIQDRLANNK
ncbi:P-loop containing nucleoside triphosphate hydrolase protein [Syncephalastrum racemosum]|uniref:P-loop containing nucleoside triphosphate hydrolase protein n=1 Tax=Syncephalastrum racemosum TaxID=13706 RepID=A0A1X2H9K3_SYNRA|nr:P-loop containing nucleoside triphosphate hydrolase protein [Syncephalastrum racemosum]